jgi:Dyp-type peroxidase family
MANPANPASTVGPASSQPPGLELDDIQGSVLRERPRPYAGAYFFLRLADAEQGREFLRRLLPYVASATNWWTPPPKATINLALSFQGLMALGVPQASLDSFPEEFRAGMAARAAILGDDGESAPEHWDAPLGGGQLHVALILASRSAEELTTAITTAQQALRELPAVVVLSRIDVGILPSGREHFGYRDGIDEPLIEGSGSPGYPGQGPAIKAGEFLLGYLDEQGELPPMPEPEVLGRNGTYLAFRKFHQQVADFRRFLAESGSTEDERALVAAKVLGRWPSGAPLMLAPEHDDPELGADPQRNNNFRYFDADPQGLICPLGAHIRRVNPRDALKGTISSDVNRHRILRRGTTYGPMLPEGVLDDDGASRGIIFIFMGASLTRQFEFVTSQWINDGNFVGLDEEKDALVGNNDGTGTFTIPQRPIRRRLTGLHRFVVTRGGEYCFLPSIRALRWLCDLGNTGSGAQ